MSDAVNTIIIIAFGFFLYLITNDHIEDTKEKILRAIKERGENSGNNNE